MSSLLKLSVHSSNFVPVVVSVEEGKDDDGENVVDIVGMKVVDPCGLGIGHWHVLHLCGQIKYTGP